MIRKLPLLSAPVKILSLHFLHVQLHGIYFLCALWFALLLDSCFNRFPPHYVWFQGLRYWVLFSHVPLSPRPPPPPIKAEWTPREPLALYCPSSMTPMWPEERNIVLILPDTGSGRSLLFLYLIVVFCFLLLLFAVDFLAKYCIFSQEKLAEYRRAFEEVSKHLRITWIHAHDAFYWHRFWGKTSIFLNKEQKWWTCLV